VIVYVAVYCHPFFGLYVRAYEYRPDHIPIPLITTFILTILSIAAIYALFIINHNTMRRYKRIKITLIPSLDLIPYIGAIARGAIEWYFLCFRVNLYWTVKQKEVSPKIYDRTFE
jgi:hypothetical protein